MIFGIGVDTIEIKRVEKAIQKTRFLKTIFTEKEIEEISIHKKRCASDFAGKEAAAKMFGTGFGSIRPIDIEILRSENGKPYINLHGSAKEFAKANHITKVHLSITNTKELATAFVLGENHTETESVK
jgi:holo-[acyl-carrier protein] synthase